MEMKKKGIIFSLDSMIALIIAGIFIFGAMVYLGNLQDKNENNLILNQIARDSLTILDFSYDLIQAGSTGDNTTLNDFVDNLETNTCARIGIYNQSKQLDFTSTKSGCIPNNNVAVARRSFIVNKEGYYAKMEVWPA
jgi:hypothetical protein